MTTPRRSRRPGIVGLAGALIIGIGAVTPVAAHRSGGGYLTGQDEMLTPVAANARAHALITVGEVVGDYRFEAIPDGIAVRRGAGSTVEVFVNHETSRVAFPYVAAGPTPSNSLNDFDNSQLSRLVLSRHDGAVLDAELAITSDDRFHRFCSNFLATREHGFSRDILFTNEEATDFVYRAGQGPEWTQPIAAGTPNAEQAGVVVAFDPATGDHRPIYGMGRLNHENSVAIPGFDEILVLTGDDTFTTNPAQSQVYGYFAESADAVWNDQGALWGFRAKDWRTYNDYYDFTPGAGTSIEGEFVRIPADAAKGDQTALERASDAAGVFEFVRVEDMAYDRRDPNIVYIADSGRANVANGTGVTYDASGQRIEAVATFASRNGRIWKMVLDPKDPHHVKSLSILIEGDDIALATQDPSASLAAIHQPDNLETTRNSLLITEDPSSANQYPVATGNTARVWWYHLSGPKKGTREVAFKVDQSADQGLTDRDPTTQTPPGAVPSGFGLGNAGSWEASGIIDVSRWFGSGWFLIDVQAHTLWVDVAPGPDVVAPAGPDWTYKREGGQLLLVRIPGA
ncbi:MAG TPA: hypothetical protein VK867_07350 [Candidatus Limnocylindrales bacterium]|nr:hypothetical protein [Candidatus Limnocylindrales bacterium]